MNFDLSLENIVEIYTASSSLGVLILLLLIISIWVILKISPLGKLSICFEVMYEKAYDFFSEILEDDFSMFAKNFVVILFFIILLSNALAIVLEILAPVFGVSSDGVFHIEHYITMPSTDLNFNIALAVMSMVMLLAIQFWGMGWKKFLYDYMPVFGKWYISVEKWSMHKALYYPLAFFAKSFDILISLFLAALELIGLAAKIISLSFRLFGNMTSGTVLLWMLVVGMSAMTTQWTGFLWGINFPIILPVFVYLQEILIALIQAIVFPLLVAVFMKVANTA